MLQGLTPPSYLKMLSGRGPSPPEVQSLLRGLPHMVLYVTSTGITENSPEAADVLYAYPSDITDHPLSPTFRLFKSRGVFVTCLLYTSPSPRDATLSRMPSSA